MPYKLYQVDAFSSTPFGGNPAAVCLLEHDSPPLDDNTRQKIAAEMNLSETSFVETLADAGPDAPTTASSKRFKLRWNTPEKEVQLCGHATVAAAAAILEGEGNQAGAVTFETVWSGNLVVRRNTAATPAEYEMDLPNEAPGTEVPEWARPGSQLLKELLGNSQELFKEVRYASRLQYLMVVLKEGTTRQQLEALKPSSYGLLSSASKDDIVVLILTVAPGSSDPEHDFLSRCFCPWAGIPEDPVTGSAHAVLGPYWSDVLGKTQLTARQCSKRGGKLKVTVEKPGGRVLVSGAACIVSRGQLLL